MPFSPPNSEMTCHICQESAGRHRSGDGACPARRRRRGAEGTWALNARFTTDVFRPIVPGNGPFSPRPEPPEPPAETGLPQLWPNTELHHALAEGIFILASRLYKHTGQKHALVSITLDREMMTGMGLPPEGCEIMIAVGPVTVIGGPG